MVNESLTPTRALRRPRRFDWRVLAGALLLLVSVIGTITFWSSATDTRAVLVARRDLPAGATIGMADLGVARVRLDDSLYAAALPAAEQAGLAGKQLAEPLHAGQILVRAQVAGPAPLASDQLALTIAIKADTAAGGKLRPGDAVRVFLTQNKGKPDSHTLVVLERVTVYDAGHEERLTVANPAGAASGTSAADTGPLTSLTLIVTPEQAIQLANAKWNGDLDVALLPPAPAAPVAER